MAKNLKFSQYTQEGLRIVDKRGLPFETIEERNLAFEESTLVNSIFEDLSYCENYHHETEFAGVKLYIEQTYGIKF